MTKKYTSLEHLIRQIVTEGGVGFGTKGGDKAKGTSGAFYNSYSSKHGGHSSAIARIAAKDSGKENIKMEEYRNDPLVKNQPPINATGDGDQERTNKLAAMATGNVAKPAKLSPSERANAEKAAVNMEEAEEDKSNQASIDRIQRAADAIRAMTKPTTPVKLPNVDEFDLDQLKTGMKKTVKEDGSVPNEGNATPTSKAYGSFDEDGKKKKLKEEKIVVKPKPVENVKEKPQGSKGKKPAGEEDNLVYPDGSNKPNEKPTQEKPKKPEEPEEPNKPKETEKPEEAKGSKLSKAAGFAAGLLGGRLAAGLLGGSSGGSTDGVQDWQYLSPGSIGTSAGSKFPLRKTVKEEVEGTMLRRNIENVARPKSALSSFDRKSKLAKQAEIKTKIIDEEKKLGSVIRKAVAEKKTREEKESSISDGKTKVVDNVIFNPPLNKVNVNEGKKKAEYEDSDESVPKTNFPYYKSMQAPPGEPQGGYDKQKNEPKTPPGPSYTMVTPEPLPKTEPKTEPKTLPGEAQGGYDKQKNDNLTDFGKAAGVAAGAAGAVGAAKYAKGEIGSAKAGGKWGGIIGAAQEYLNPTREKDDDNKSPVQWLDKKDEKGNNKQGVLSNIGQSAVAGAAGSTKLGMLLDPDLSIPYPNLPSLNWNAKSWDEFKNKPLSTSWDEYVEKFKKEPLKSFTIQKGSLNDGEQEALNKLRAKAHKSGFTPPGFASKEHYDQYKKEHGPIAFDTDKGEYVLPKNAPHPKDYSDSLSKGKQ